MPIPLDSKLAHFRRAVCGHTGRCFGCEKPLPTDAPRLLLIVGDEAEGGTPICHKCYATLTAWPGWNRREN
jgi:hypothetical protein